MKTSQRRMVTAAVAIVIVIVAGLVIRNCGIGGRETVSIKSGQTKTLGSINWSVVSVLKVKAIQPSGVNLTSAGWFLIVDMYLSNTTQETVQLKSDSFTLTDDAGKTYSPDKKATDAQLKAMQSLDISSIFNASLKPSSKHRVMMVFDITETAAKLKLKAAASDYGANKDLVIDLGF
jgi:hypothetical protein